MTSHKNKCKCFTFVLDHACEVNRGTCTPFAITERELSDHDISFFSFCASKKYKLKIIKNAERHLRKLGMNHTISKLPLPSSFAFKCSYLHIA